jgi:hypothetical protein
MPGWLVSTAKTAGKLAFAALVAALLSAWLFAPSKAAGRDAYFGVVVDPNVNIGKALSRLANLRVHTVRLRMDVKDWGRPAANTGAPEYDGALNQAPPLHQQGFQVVLQVNSVGGVVPSYARATALFEWLLRRPGAGSVDVVEVLGPVTDHDTDVDAFSPTLSLDAQAQHYVNGPLRAAWDAFHRRAGKKVLGAAFSVWQQARDYSPVATYTLAVTRAYVRAGYLKYVDAAGLRPYVTSPTSQVEWARQAKALFGATPMWISEWGLTRTDYASLAAYSNAMTKAVGPLRRWVAVVCYANATPSATSDGLISAGLTGYVPVQPAYDTYRSWTKGQ